MAKCKALTGSAVKGLRWGGARAGKHVSVNLTEMWGTVSL